MLQARLKERVCKACKIRFMRSRPMQAVCSPLCAAALVTSRRSKDAEKAAQADRKATRKALEKLKTRRQWLDEAQTIANKYARLRDHALGCVSCDLPPTWPGQWHGSHFRSVGAASAVRLNLWNIHKACSICNNWKSGNLSEFEPRLRLKIGDEKVDWLRTQNQLATYSVEYLLRYKAVIGKRARRLEARLASQM